MVLLLGDDLIDGKTRGGGDNGKQLESMDTTL